MRSWRERYEGLARVRTVRPAVSTVSQVVVRPLDLGMDDGCRTVYLPGLDTDGDDAIIPVNYDPDICSE